MTLNTPPILINLEDLRSANKFPGITPALGSVHLEACLVALHNFAHSVGVNLNLAGHANATYQIQWSTPVDVRMKNAWNDQQRVNEFAACGLAFFVVFTQSPYTIIRISPKGTGFDYYLGTKIINPSDPNIFKDSARLEISGIDRETKTNNLKTRKNRKIKQVSVSNHTGKPAYIVCVEHQTPKAELTIV